MTEKSTQRDSFWRRLCQGVRRFTHRNDWTGFVGTDWDEEVMTLPVTDRFHAKQGRSTGRLILTQNDDRLVVYLKRHYRLPWWKGILATLWPGQGWSPALQEQKHLEWAREQGLPVPHVVAAGEKIGPWGKFESFLAVEELTDMLPLHEAIPLAHSQLDGKTFAQWKRELITEMVRLVRTLHDHRWFHRDLYLCHFYVTRQDTERIPNWRDRVHLIDFHRLAHHRHLWRLWQSKDIAQLLYSSDVTGVTWRDRWRFWKLYLGEQEKHHKRGWLSWMIRWRWGNYRNHNEKRRRRELEKAANASLQNSS